MTNAAKQQILRSETYARFPFLIEVTVPGDGVYRYANSDSDIAYGGYTYEAACFSIEPPEVKNGEISNGTLSISAIDETWVNKIRGVSSKCSLKFVAAIDYSSGSAGAIEEIETRTFTLTEASWEDTVISWTLVFDELGDIQIPVDECNIFVCPSLA